jgi:small subunit ribosomal protein S13
MARLAGVDLPAKKRAEIGLTYIYGIGRTRAKSLCYRAGIDPDKKIADLTEDEVNRVRIILEAEGEVEGDLRKEISLNIKRLIEMGSYRGLRHCGQQEKGNRKDLGSESKHGESTRKNRQKEDLQEKREAQCAHWIGARAGFLQQHHHHDYRPHGERPVVVEFGIAGLSRIAQRHAVRGAAGFADGGE